MKKSCIKVAYFQQKKLKPKIKRIRYSNKVNTNEYKKTCTVVLKSLVDGFVRFELLKEIKDQTRKINLRVEESIYDIFLTMLDKTKGPVINKNHGDQQCNEKTLDQICLSPYHRYHLCNLLLFYWKCKNPLLLSILSLSCTLTVIVEIHTLVVVHL